MTDEYLKALRAKAVIPCSEKQFKYLAFLCRKAGYTENHAAAFAKVRGIEKVGLNTATAGTWIDALVLSLKNRKDELG